MPDHQGGHIPGLGAPVQEGLLDHGHNEGQGQGVYEVDKLGVEEGLDAGARPLARVLQGPQEHRHDGTWISLGTLEGRQEESSRIPRSTSGARRVGRSMSLGSTNLGISPISRL